MKKKKADKGIIMVAENGMYQPYNPYNPWQTPAIDNIQMPNYQPIYTQGSQNIVSPSDLNENNMMQVPPNSSSQSKPSKNNASMIGRIAQSIGSSVGNALNIGAAIQGVNALIPEQRQRIDRTIPRGYNPYSYGTGSQAIYANGGDIYHTETGRKHNISTTQEVPNMMTPLPTRDENIYNSPISQFHPYPTTVPSVPQRKSISYEQLYNPLTGSNEYSPVFGGNWSKGEVRNYMKNIPDTYNNAPVIKGEAYNDFWNMRSDVGSDQWQPTYGTRQNVLNNLYSQIPEFEEGGNLSRQEDYGSKEHPYPSVASSDFAGPNRTYPIPSRSNAVDALRLAGLHHNEAVKAKVYKKYPDLKKENGGDLGTYSDLHGNRTPIYYGYNQTDYSQMEDGGYLYSDLHGARPMPMNSVSDYSQVPYDDSCDDYPEARNGIHINPKNKGKFNALKKRTGKTTEELTHSKNPLTRKRAIFAQNAAKWKHEDGGDVQPYFVPGQEYDLDEATINNLRKQGYIIE